MTVEFNQDIYEIDFTDPANGSFAIQPFTTNGPLSPTSTSLAPSASSANTSLTLVGRGLPGWGEAVLENLVHLLENFASPTPPTFIIPGQVWFDNSTDTLNVRNQANDTWHTIPTTASDFDFGGNKGINLGDATNPTDAMNQQSSDARYVNLNGDTMTGVLTLDADPVNPLEAATKQYVDTEVAAGPFVELTGDTMSGLLILSGDPVAALGAATKQYVDNTTVSLSGDTMTGFLTLSANPTINFHAATKQYVDSQVASVGGDGVVDSGTFDGLSGGGTLTLTRTESLPDVTITGLNSGEYSATQVSYTAVEGNRLENVAPETTLLEFSQDFANFIFDTAAQRIAERNKRQIAMGSDFSGSTLTLNFSYPVESNRLQVFLRESGSTEMTGAQKLRADERGFSIIDFAEPDEGVFASTLTGLPDTATTFDFDIDVDSGGAVTVSIAGEDAQIFGAHFADATLGLVGAMNDAFTTGGIGAVATFEEEQILVFSDSTGAGSSVVITDVDLFSQIKPETTQVDFNPIVSGVNITNGAAVPGDFWTIESTTTSYYVWYDDGVVTDPAPGGTGIAVSFTTADSPALLASNTAAALVASGDPDFAGASDSSGVVTVTLATSGSVTDATQGSFPSTAPTIIVTVTTQGITTSIDNSNTGVSWDYSEDGPALSDSTTITLPGAPAAGDEFEIIRIK